MVPFNIRLQSAVAIADGTENTCTNLHGNLRQHSRHGIYDPRAICLLVEPWIEYGHLETSRRRLECRKMALASALRPGQTVLAPK